MLTRREMEFLVVAKAYIELRNLEPIPPGEVPWPCERGGGTWVNRRVRELEAKTGRGRDDTRVSG
jgi:hypothetical protein